jgi:predicted transcriptional regulator
MRLKNLTFIRPDKKYRELTLLMSIDDNNLTSQRKLAVLSGISSAVVNEYVEDMKQNGLIDYQKTDGKSYTYHLTQTGKKYKDTLFFQFSKEIVQIYLTIKDEIKRRLLYIASPQLKKVVLFGAGEIAEVIYHVSPQIPLEIVGIVDNDKAKHGKHIGTLKITPPSEITNLNPDAVVITSFSHAEEIYQQIKFLENNIKIFRL